MPASEVMGKWKRGELHSGSKKGPVVKSQKQAVAIMLSEKRKGLQGGGPTGDEKPDFTGITSTEREKELNPVRTPTMPKRPNRPAEKPKGPSGYRKGGHVDKDEVSGRAAFAQNVAETLANPTGRTGLAKGGTVDPPAGGGWRRWGQGGRHPHG